MGKLEEKSDGFFVLDTNVGAIHITKVFQEVEKPLDEVSSEPMEGGFYLDVPDR